MPAIIVLGDRTDHGGEVIEASAFTDTHGRRIARVGDKVHCPRKGHGTTEIIQGDMTFVVDGRAVAYHGCRTSCGAQLISSQSVTSVEFGRGSAVVSSPPVSSTSVFTSQQTLVNTSPYDEQLIAVNAHDGKAIAGLAYFVRTTSGAIHSGFTDGTGRIPRIGTVSEEELSVWFGLAAMHMEDLHNG